MSSVGNFYFDPTSAAIRKVMAFSFVSVSEIEWYRAMIGEYMHLMLRAINTMENMNWTDQYMVATAINGAQNIKTLSDVEKIQQLAKVNGIISALEHVGEI